MSIRVVIPTVEPRLGNARDLALLVGGDIVVDPVGDGSERSATDNHLRALQVATPSDEWVVVLEDDAVPVSNFSEILARQLSEVDTDRIVSLYLGKNRPPSIQPTIGRTIARADEDVSWMTTRMLWWGVGVCIPQRYVESVSDYVLSVDKPWDTSVGTWALKNQVDVWYTWPSLVDHLDEETTILHADGQPRAQGRVAWSTGEPIPNGRHIMIE